MPSGWLVLAGFAMLAGTWLGRRDRRSGAEELLAVTPTSGAGIRAARLAALALASSIALALVFGVVLVAEASLRCPRVNRLAHPSRRLSRDDAGVVDRLRRGELAAGRLLALRPDRLRRRQLLPVSLAGHEHPRLVDRVAAADATGSELVGRSRVLAEHLPRAHRVPGGAALVDWRRHDRVTASTRDRAARASSRSARRRHPGLGHGRVAGRRSADQAGQLRRRQPEPGDLGTGVQHGSRQHRLRLHPWFPTPLRRAPQGAATTCDVSAWLDAHAPVSCATDSSLRFVSTGTTDRSAARRLLTDLRQQASVLAGLFRRPVTVGMVPVDNLGNCSGGLGRISISESWIAYGLSLAPDYLVSCAFPSEAEQRRPSRR